MPIWILIIDKAEANFSGHRTLITDYEDETDLQDAIFKTKHSKSHFMQSSNEQLPDNDESGDYNYVSK